MFQRIREHCAVKGITRLDLPDLKLISASGAPLDLDLKQGMERLMWTAWRVQRLSPSSHADDTAARRRG
jgi:hypothetical protein